MTTPPKSISGLTSAAAARVVLFQSGEFVTVPGNVMGLLPTSSVSSFMLTLLDDADAAAARATLGIDEPNEQRRNRIVNGAMQISQENGNTAGTGTARYGADQFYTQFISGAGTFTTQRVQSATPNGSKDRYRITITVADTVLGATEYLYIRHNLEGTHVADLRYGTGDAVQSVFRFGFKGPAGTYAVALRNNAFDRTFVALFTITSGEANTDTEQIITIPGDTTGTWLSDTGIGIMLHIVFACGTTPQGVLGWQAGNKLATSAISNGMATVGAVFELFDVGWYRDDMLTGVPPPWEMPDYAEELWRCQRYWRFNPGMVGRFGDTTQFTVQGQFSPPMRVSPSLGILGGAVVNITFIGNPVLASIITNGVSAGGQAYVHAAVTAGTGSTGQLCYLFEGTLEFNARM